MPPQRERSFYTVLGIPEDAGTEGMRAAYLKLALKHHPDRNPGDRASEEIFKAVSQAYAVLRDPAARTRYDRLLAKKRSKARSKAPPRGAGDRKGAAAGQKGAQDLKPPRGGPRKVPETGRKGAGEADSPGSGPGRDGKSPGRERTAARTGKAGTPFSGEGAGRDAAGRASAFKAPGADRKPGTGASGGTGPGTDGRIRTGKSGTAAGTGTGAAQGRAGNPGTYDSFGRITPPPGTPGNKAAGTGRGDAGAGKPVRGDPEDIILTFFTTPDGRVSLKKIREELAKSGLGDRSPVLDRLGEKSSRPFWSPIKDAVASGLKKIGGRLFSNPLAPGGPALSGEDLVFSLALSPEAAMSGTTVEVQYFQDGRDRRLSVKVPPGIRDGARLRLAGQGNLRPGGGRGDLLLNLTVPR